MFLRWGLTIRFSVGGGMGAPGEGESHWGPRWDRCLPPCRTRPTGWMSMLFARVAQSGMSGVMEPGGIRGSRLAGSSSLPPTAVSRAPSKVDVFALGAADWSIWHY